MAQWPGNDSFSAGSNFAGETLMAVRSRKLPGRAREKVSAGYKNGENVVNLLAALEDK
jgi:hypothetical protein